MMIKTMVIWAISIVKATLVVKPIVIMIVILKMMQMMTNPIEFLMILHRIYTQIIITQYIYKYTTIVYNKMCMKVFLIINKLMKKILKKMILRNHIRHKINMFKEIKMEKKYYWTTENQNMKLYKKKKNLTKPKSRIEKMKVNFLS